jgi:hypothetical protein
MNNSIGGKGSVPQSQEVCNEFVNGTGTAEDIIARLVPLFFPQKWRNENPNYLETQNKRLGRSDTWGCENCKQK